MKYIYKDWLIDILRKCFVLFIEMNRLGKNGTLTMEAKNIQQLILYEDNISLLDLVYIFCRQQYFYKDIKKHFKTINHHNNKATWKDVLLSHPLVKNV